MMKRTLGSLVLGLLVAGSASAATEGVVEMKITSAHGMNGTGKSYVSKVGIRSEMEMSSPQMQQPFKMVWLMKLDNRDVAYVLNDAKKTYAEMNLKEMREAVKEKKGSEETYTVKKLGKESILGHSCDHVLVTRSGGTGDTELWLTQEFFGDPALLRSFTRDQSSTGLFKALREAGVEGFPMKMVVHEKEKEAAAMTMEVTRIEKRPVPASMFEIPAGYTKSESMLGAMSLTPEQEARMKEAQERMKKAMENMTPEQRKQMEEMMKKMGQQPAK